VKCHVDPNAKRIWVFFQKGLNAVMVTDEMTDAVVWNKQFKKPEDVIVLYDRRADI